MPFFQMDDGFDSEERVGRAGTAAFGLYSRCGVWVARNLTDGFVPDWVATMYGSAEWVRKLVETQLWAPVTGGFMMPDYLERHRNKPRVKVLAERALKAARQANWLAKKQHKPSSNGKSVSRPASRRVSGASRDASQDGLETPTHPLPSPKGEGVDVAPLSGGAAPPTQDHAQPPRDSPAVCAIHHQPHPCHTCIADGKAAAAATYAPGAPKPSPTRSRVEHPPPPGDDPAYDEAHRALHALPITALDPLLTRARAQLAAGGNRSPTTRELTLLAAQLIEPEEHTP